MPLKPFYEKSPLVTLKACALRPGQVKTSMSAPSAVYQLACAYTDHVEMLEGLFRLSAIVTEKPLEEPAAKQIETLLAGQQEDGRLGLAPHEEVALMRAAFAMYEMNPSRPMLLCFGRWCSHLSSEWEDFIADNRVRQSPADLMELLENLYRIMEKKAILSLCDRLRHEGMDWSSVLHTFSVQKDMKKIIKSEDLINGMEQENGSEAGFHTRQYITCHGEMLADGVRSALASGIFSGNNQELKASRVGWERISRHHCAVCGAISADETIAGLSPSAAIDAASIGAWAEALAAQDTQEDCAWALDALDILTENALRATVQGGKLVPYQRVNSLKAQCGTVDCQILHEEEAQKVRSLNRLARAWAAVLSHAVLSAPYGIRISRLTEVTCVLPVHESAVRLKISGEGGKFRIRVAVKSPVEAEIRLFVPAWANDPSVEVNQRRLEPDISGSWMSVMKKWETNDEIVIDLGASVRLVEGYHQSQSIFIGNRLMALPADVQNFAYALVSVNDQGDAQFCAIDCWKQRNGIPADLPVLPKAGNIIGTETLKPYGDCPCRIASFPKGRKA